MIEENNVVTPAENIATPKTEEKDYILEVEGLKQYFPISKDFFGRPVSYLRAVDGVSFKLERGKTLGVVGESGCGKTTLGRTILRLYDVTEGKATYNSLSNKKYNESWVVFQPHTYSRTQNLLSEFANSLKDNSIIISLCPILVNMLFTQKETIRKPSINSAFYNLLRFL